MIDKTRAKLANYNGSEILVIGKVNFECRIKDKIQNLDFYIANCSQTIPVLGLQTIVELELVKRIADIKLNDTNIKELINKYEEVFQGIGKIAKIHDFKLKPDYVSKIEQC